MDGEKRDYAKDDNELKELWRRTLKYEVLNRFVSEIEENETAETPRTHEELELETREKVQKIYKDWYGRMDQLRRSDRFEVFMGALTHGFDPHSDYSIRTARVVRDLAARETVLEDVAILEYVLTRCK